MGEYTKYLVATGDETQLKLFFQSDVGRYIAFSTLGSSIISREISGLHDVLDVLLSDFWEIS